MISQIISGGQTGADRGALDAAIQCSVQHGGMCPKGRLAEDGEIPAQYNLIEMPNKSYLKRTEANVWNADATLIFCYGKPSGGTKRTVEFAQKHGRPFLAVDLKVLNHDRAVLIVQDWLDDLNTDSEFVLNVAGPRESKQPGIAADVRDILIAILKGN